MYFRNPTNGYVEPSSKPGLKCFFFGPLYFAAKGAWPHVFIYPMVVLSTFGVALFVYPFFARAIIYRSFAKRGWSPVNRQNELLALV